MPASHGSKRDSTVMLGTPVKPSAASSAAVMPVAAPQPIACLTIAGCSTSRHIGASGALYSAIPTASAVCSTLSPSSLAATAAQAGAPQLPQAR